MPLRPFLAMVLALDGVLIDHRSLPDDECQRQLGWGAILMGAVPPERVGVVGRGDEAQARGRMRRAGLPEPAVVVGEADAAAPHAFAAELLGLRAADCLAVEATPEGVRAARAAGMAVAAVATSHRGDALGAADLCADDPRALLPHVRAARRVPEIEAALARIDGAFSRVPRPPDGELLARDCSDDMDIEGLYGIPDWRDVPDEAFDGVYAGVFSLSPAGLRAFLPAYMGAVLRHPDEGLAVAGSTLHALTRRPPWEERFDERRAMFDGPQRAAIRAFLEAMAGFEPDAREALACWNEQP